MVVLNVSMAYGIDRIHASVRISPSMVNNISRFDRNQEHL